MLRLLCLPAGFRACAAMASHLAGRSGLSRELAGDGGESLLLLLRSCPAAPPSFGPLLPPPCFVEALPAPGPFPPAAPGLPPFPFPRLPAAFGPAPPPPLPRPLPLHAAPCPPAKRDSPRRRPPERASPGSKNSAPASDDQPPPPPRYRFTAQELHAVLYGALPGGGRQSRALSAGGHQPRSPGRRAASARGQGARRRGPLQAARGAVRCARPWAQPESAGRRLLPHAARSCAASPRGANGTCCRGLRLLRLAAELLHQRAAVRGLLEVCVRLPVRNWVQPRGVLWHLKDKHNHGRVGFRGLHPTFSGANDSLGHLDLMKSTVASKRKFILEQLC